ncbi:TPA_asm: hypothetical protein GZX72_14360 [Listeria monocytogenes]|nr:hypothetical protein [Listeria monocytogenes]
MHRARRIILTLLTTVLIMTLAVIPNYVSETVPMFKENIAQADEQSIKAEELIKKANDGDLSEKEETELQHQVKSGKIEQEGDKYRLGASAQVDNRIWTLYARILMDSGETEKQNKKDKVKKDKDDGMVEGAIKNTIGQFTGDGGVEVTIPYNKMFTLGKELDQKNGGGDNATQAGRQLASFFSTFSHYGYIETVSGDVLASSGNQFITTIVRGIAGFIMMLAVIVHALFNNILGGLVSFIGKLDLFSLLGFTDSQTLKENTKNPIVKAIYSFIEGLGLTPQLFHAIVTTSFFLITALFVFRLMRTLSNDGFHMGQLGDSTRRFLVRFLVLFPLPLLMMMLIGGFAKQLDDINNSSKFNPTPAQQYILNDRKWASAINLSPNAMQQQGRSPNVGSDKHHIDGEFAPSNARNLISQINYESYKRMDNIDDENSMKMSFDLIFGFMENDTFDVNTYMADIRQRPASGGDVTETYSAYKNLDVLGEKVDPVTLENYIWTAKPISESNKKEAKPTHKKFQPSANTGVENDSTFSTQSVALMLQTSFENNSAVFYAYNIPPSGTQGMAKNMSTVKTQWREYTMPGEGAFGKFGSFLAMITQSIFQIVIILACIHALLFTNFFKGCFLAFKHYLLALGTGSPAHLLVCFLLGLTAPLSGFIAYSLPSLLVSAINIFTKGAVGVINAFEIQNVDGLVDVSRSLLFLFASFYLVVVKVQTGTNIITAIISLSNDIGLDLAKKANSIMRTREQARHAVRLANRVSKQQTQGAMSNVAGGVNRESAGATWQAVKNPSSWSDYATAYAKNQNLNKGQTTPTAETQSARDFAVQQSKGSNSSTGRSGTARSVLLGQENPNADSHVKHPYGTKNYFVNSQSSVNAREMSPEDVKAENENKERNAMFNRHAEDLPSAIHSGSALDYAKEQSKAKENERDESNSSSDNRLSNEEPSVDTLTGGKSNRNQPTFNEREIKSLQSSRNVGDFQENLYFTHNGQNTALSQHDAKASLRGSEFMKPNGDIDYNRIDKFNAELSNKHLEDLTEEQFKRKQKLDYAFRQGASNIYDNYKKY